MEIKVDGQHQFETTVGSLDPSRPWALGPAVDEDSSIVEPGWRQSSYWAECECPDDCLRDHENE